MGSSPVSGGSRPAVYKTSARLWNQSILPLVPTARPARCTRERVLTSLSPFARVRWRMWVSLLYSLIHVGDSIRIDRGSLAGAATDGLVFVPFCRLPTARFWHQRVVRHRDKMIAALTVFHGSVVRSFCILGKVSSRSWRDDRHLDCSHRSCRGSSCDSRTVSPTCSAVGGDL